jgi:hypothetical protein
VERNLFNNVIKHYSKRNNGNKVNNKYDNAVDIKIVDYKADRNGKKKYIYL